MFQLIVICFRNKEPPANSYLTKMYSYVLIHWPCLPEVASLPLKFNGFLSIFCDLSRKSFSQETWAINILSFPSKIRRKFQSIPKVETQQKSWQSAEKFDWFISCGSLMRNIWSFFTFCITLRFHLVWHAKSYVFMSLKLCLVEKKAEIE